MANTITPNTVCRAVSGLIREKTVDAFVRIGGDYRSEQKSCVQKLMNWLAQCFDKNYATRTLSEVNYKKKALGSDFQGFATQVLKAKLADDYTVCIPFEIDNQQLEIVSYPANPKKLYVRHQWTDTELEGVHLATLKSILLKEYIDLQKKSEYETGLINLTEFELLGLDLREMDFTGCSLPDLVRCRLSGIKFDRSTNFNSGRRKMCEIDDVTLDRLHQHKLSSRELVVQEFSDGVREGGTCTDHFTYPDDQKPSTYNYGQIFNSDNLDLATIKRFHLQYDRKGIVKCFKEMRQNGIPINLAHVDLSGLDLSKMDLSGVNLDRKSVV